MPAPQDPIAFSEAQRRVLIGLMIAIVLLLGFRLTRNPTQIADPPPARGEKSSMLRDRIDPNTADVPTLAALPGLGDKRAQEIVSYRERAFREHPTTQPFRRREDLMRVDGIGPAMMMQLSPYMVFPQMPSTTNRSGIAEN